MLLVFSALTLLRSLGTCGARTCRRRSQQSHCVRSVMVMPEANAPGVGRACSARFCSFGNLGAFRPEALSFVVGAAVFLYCSGNGEAAEGRVGFTRNAASGWHVLATRPGPPEIRGRSEVGMPLRGQDVSHQTCLTQCSHAHRHRWS